jgi:hypothetical protein
VTKSSILAAGTGAVENQRRLHRRRQALFANGRRRAEKPDEADRGTLAQWNIASIPNLARHSRSLGGDPLANYFAASNQRFQQWILDTCLRPYDQTWLDYQQEIALRHTSLKKNRVDGVQSTPHVPLRDIIAFIPVMNETIKPYMAAKGNSGEELEKMHQAWCKSLQLQLALWTGLYARLTPGEW